MISHPQLVLMVGRLGWFMPKMPATSESRSMNGEHPVDVGGATSFSAAIGVEGFAKVFEGAPPVAHQSIPSVNNHCRNSY